MEKFREYRLSQRLKRVLKKKNKEIDRNHNSLRSHCSDEVGKGVTISACSLQQTAILSATEDVVVDALH